jgi:hypothetical protein
MESEIEILVDAQDGAFRISKNLGPEVTRRSISHHLSESAHVGLPDFYHQDLSLKKCCNSTCALHDFPKKSQKIFSINISRILHGTYIHLKQKARQLFIWNLNLIGYFIFLFMKSGNVLP